MNNVVLIEFKKKKDRAGCTEGTGNMNWKAVRNPGLPLPLSLSSVPVCLKLLPMITNFLCSSGYNARMWVHHSLCTLVSAPMQQ